MVIARKKMTFILLLFKVNFLFVLWKTPRKKWSHEISILTNRTAQKKEIRKQNLDPVDPDGINQGLSLKCILDVLVVMWSSGCLCEAGALGRSRPEILSESHPHIFGI